MYVGTPLTDIIKQKISKYVYTMHIEEVITISIKLYNVST